MMLPLMCTGHQLKVPGGIPRAEQWETWDVRRSLFDNHVSASFEANMEYMYKKFGFYFPDAHYLVDPEGLLKYLVCLRPPHATPVRACMLHVSI